MHLVISSKTNQPIYEQIFDQIVAQIVTGELPADFCLPSIRVIATQIGVSIITIKKAWEMLERHQFILTVPGKGCFVKKYAPETMDDKRLDMAKDKLQEDLLYYKNLGLSMDQIMDIIKKTY
jgi:GntR family transcriptional regulator